MPDQRALEGSYLIARRQLTSHASYVPTRPVPLPGKAPLPGAGYRCSACRPPISVSKGPHHVFGGYPPKTTPDPAAAFGEAPLKVLTQRYALGQITKEDVGHIKQDIA